MGWVVNHALVALHPTKIHFSEAGRPPSSVSTTAKILAPNGIRSLDRPALASTWKKMRLDRTKYAAGFIQNMTGTLHSGREALPYARPISRRQTIICQPADWAHPHDLHTTTWPHSVSYRTLRSVFSLCFPSTLMTSITIWSQNHATSE